MKFYNITDNVRMEQARVTADRSTERLGRKQILFRVPAGPPEADPCQLHPERGDR